ncbi:dienelactone hydrolase family protein [Planctomycetota bacterium]
MESRSFIDFLERYGRTVPPSMRFSENITDYAKWKTGFYEKLNSLLGPVPGRSDLAVETLDVEEGDHYTTKLMTVTVNEFSDLPFYCLTPKDINEGEKRPAVIALHGHTAQGMETIAGRSNDAEKTPNRGYGRCAAEAGYVVMIPAWWGWPGRNGHIDVVGNRDKCNVIQMAAAMYGLNVLSMHIQDGTALVDVLAEMPEVDTDGIACMGHSYGGRTAMWLTVFDKRISVCIASGCMNTFRERSLILSSCGIQYLPGLLRYGDVAEVFSLIAPRPLQLMAGKSDPLLNGEDKKLILDTACRAYASEGKEDNLDYAQHEGGHDFRWDLAEPFLKRHL